MIIMMQYSCLPRSIKFIQLFSAVVIFFENNKIEPWHEHSFVVIKQDGSDEPHLNKLTKHIMAVIWYIQHGHMCILHHHNVKVIFYPRSCLKEEESLRKYFLLFYLNLHMHTAARRRTATSGWSHVGNKGSIT